MTDIDTVAEAIWRADAPRAATAHSWEELSAEGNWRVYYRELAQTAIDALGLTEEWAACTEDDVINEVICVDEHTDEYRLAEEWAKERCKSCDHCRNAQPKFIAKRQVSPWVRVGEQT